jgi:hypothetical protein
MGAQKEMAEVEMTPVRIPFPNLIQDRFQLLVGPKTPEAGNGRHYYVVQADDDPIPLLELQFQCGELNEPNSKVNGVLTTVILAALVDHLQSFQEGEFASRETALMITHLQEVQNWAARRQDDRSARGIQGKHAR